MIKGIVKYQPESARGTTRISRPIPMVSKANPALMILLGRAFSACFPASNATANMLSESGASARPASMASYSSTICRKIGSAIIAPPSAICCSICPEIPIRKWADRNRSGSSKVSLPSRFRRTSHQASPASERTPTASTTPTDSPPPARGECSARRRPCPERRAPHQRRRCPAAPCTAHPSPADFRRAPPR